MFPYPCWLPIPTASLLFVARIALHPAGELDSGLGPAGE